MYVFGERLYAESMFDVHVTVEVWNQCCFCIFHSTKHYFMVKWRKAHHRLGTSSNMWAAAWQNQQNDLCAERRHRSALAFAQSNQSSLSAWRTLYFKLPIECTVSAGRTGHFVVFVVQQLIWLSYYKANLFFLFPFTKAYTNVSKREGSLGWWNFFFISERGKYDKDICIKTNWISVILE